MTLKPFIPFVIAALVHENGLRKRLSFNNKRSDHFYSIKVPETWHGY